VAEKKYDPLWEIVHEKVALQGQELDLDARCPHCNVTLHLGSGRGRRSAHRLWPLREGFGSGVGRPRTELRPLPPA